MLENVDEVINKGIPVNTPVTLLSRDLLNLCSNKKKIKKTLDKSECVCYNKAIRNDNHYCL